MKMRKDDKKKKKREKKSGRIKYYMYFTRGNVKASFQNKTKMKGSKN